MLIGLQLALVADIFIQPFEIAKRSRRTLKNGFERRDQKKQFKAKGSGGGMQE